MAMLPHSWVHYYSIGTVFVVGDQIIHKQDSFTCTTQHTAASDKEPGVGASWATYWTRTADATETGGGPALRELRDVQSTGWDDGEVPAYQASSGLFVPATAGGSSAGNIIKVVQYNPGTQAAPTNNTGVLADVDATNLAVTFTVPASGRVLITLEGVARHSAASENVFWGLREGSSQVGPEASFGVPATSFNQRGVIRLLVTGLTPAASKTYKWAHRGATGTVTHIHGGATVGPATIVVQDANV